MSMTVIMVVVMASFILAGIVVVFRIEVPCRERIGKLLPCVNAQSMFIVGQQTRIQLCAPRGGIDVYADHPQFLATVADREIVEVAIPVGGNFSHQFVVAVWPLAAIPGS